MRQPTSLGNSPTVALFRHLAATLLLSLWWGGFTFYSGRVVFIGHTVLNSKIRQGFITERVTLELNCLAVIALAAVAFEFFSTIARLRCTYWLVWMVASIFTVALFPLHMKLAAMLDFDTRQLADHEHFYAWHRIYLLVATLQWLFVTVLLGILVSVREPAQKGSGDNFEPLLKT